jgi:hypothetical protein
MRTLSQSEFALLKGAYQLLGKLAREDLAVFCRANETTVCIGDRDLSYVFEGRRQVYLRIRDFTERPIEELLATYTREVTHVESE